jgi:hypothetical protein
LLSATNESEAERYLERLIEIVDPIIVGVIRRKLGCYPSRSRPAARAGSDFERLDEEVANNLSTDTIISLITRLRKSRLDYQNGIGTHAIGNFRGYAAITTNHLFDRYLRKVYPQRANLKDKLRLILNHDPRFSFWDGANGEQLCGLRQWQSERTFDYSTSLQQVRNEPRILGPAVLPDDEANLVEIIFRWVRHPVELDDLVNTVAELRGVREFVAITETQRPETGDSRIQDSPYNSEDHSPWHHIDASDPSPNEQLQWRENLHWLWTEVCLLPLDQRRVFILDCDVTLEFPREGIASLRMIATMLEMPAEQLAQLWKHLPLGDKAISKIFDVSLGLITKRRFDARRKLKRKKALKDDEEG